MLVRLEVARRRIDRARFRSPRVIRVPPEEALGLLSGGLLRAQRDRPEAPLAAMDGFAVRSLRGRGAESYLLRKALRGAVPSLRRGEATPTATGSPLPPGADAVVRLEATTVRGATLHVRSAVRPGQDVLPAGESIRRGDTLLARGEQVGPAHLAALLADDQRTVPAFDLRVSIVPVGSELRRRRGKDGSRGPQDTLGPVVRHVFECARTRVLPAVADEVGEVRRAVRQEVDRSDLVVTLGGSSVGRDDVTRRAVGGLGVFLFEGVAVNVLKRSAVARVRGTPVLILPGQIVSAVTAAHEHGLHLLGRLVGRELRSFERVTLARAIPAHHRMDSTYLFGLRASTAYPLPWGVARTSALLRADAFGILARGRAWTAGDRIRIQRLWPGTGTAKRRAASARP